MFSAGYSKCLKRVVQIKRLFHIFIVVALLLGFSSCGKKESNNFLEINLNEKTPVQIMYRQNVYNGVIFFDGLVLELSVNNGIGDKQGSKESDSINFHVDSMTCTVTHNGLEKNFDKEKLTAGFLPVVIFDFLNSTGATFKTESFYEQEAQYTISRNINQNRVTFEAYPDDVDCTYSIIIE